MSFFSRFSISPSFSLFFSPSPTPKPFLSLFLHITFLLLLSIFIFSPSYLSSQILYLFILFYFTIRKPRLYFPCFLFATELYTQSDGTRQHSYLNMSRAETKKQAFQSPAISIGFHFLNISTAALLKHFFFSSSLCTKWKRDTEAMPEHPRVYLRAKSSTTEHIPS